MINIRFNRILGRLIAGGLLLLVGCDSDSSDSPETTDVGMSSEASDTGSESSSGDPAQAEADYETYCSICHGKDGEGYVADQANALNHPDFLAIATDDFLRRAIRRGRPGTTMSSWHQDRGGPLDDKGVNGLVNLIRSWQTTPSQDVHDYVPEGEADRGETLYEIRCASCHGPEGKDGIYMTLSNPEFLVSASDGYLQYSIAKGRENVGMPAFENILTPQQLDDIIVLIRSWQVDPSDEPLVLPTLNPDTLVLNPNGPEPVFAPDENGYVSVKDVEVAYDAGSKMTLLDARLPSEYLHGHISGAVSIPFYSVEEHLDVLDPDVWILAYCACPHAESGVAADTLRDAGYTKVAVIDEGFDAWVADEYPVTEGPMP